jgi:hypothetical protein
MGRGAQGGPQRHVVRAGAVRGASAGLCRTALREAAAAAAARRRCCTHGRAWVPMLSAEYLACVHVNVVPAASVGAHLACSLYACMCVTHTRPRPRSPACRSTTTTLWRTTRPCCSWSARATTRYGRPYLGCVGACQAGRQAGKQSPCLHAISCVGPVWLPQPSAIWWCVPTPWRGGSSRHLPESCIGWGGVGWGG